MALITGLLLCQTTNARGYSLGSKKLTQKLFLQWCRGHLDTIPKNASLHRALSLSLIVMLWTRYHCICKNGDLANTLIHIGMLQGREEKKSSSQLVLLVWLKMVQQSACIYLCKLPLPIFTLLPRSSILKARMRKRGFFPFLFVNRREGDYITCLASMLKTWSFLPEASNVTVNIYHLKRCRLHIRFPFLSRSAF